MSNPLSFLPGPVQAIAAKSLIKYLEKQKIKSLVLAYDKPETAAENWQEDFKVKFYDADILKRIEFLERENSQLKQQLKIK